MKGSKQLGYKNVSSWLADTNGAISSGTYYRLVRTWHTVVIDLEIDTEPVCVLDQSKVAIVADRIGSKGVTVDDALADVVALPARGLRKKYGRPAVGRPPGKEHQGDAEQALRDHLAGITTAVAAGTGAAPDLHALRNVIAQMFESIRIVRAGRLPVGDLGPGHVPFDGDVPAVTDGHERYWLLLMLRWSCVDLATFKPIGHATPVPTWQS